MSPARGPAGNNGPDPALFFESFLESIPSVTCRTMLLSLPKISLPVSSKT